MKWPEIKALYPDKFILLGNIIEEPISSNKFKILEGDILLVSEGAKEIHQAYQAYTRQGKVDLRVKIRLFFCYLTH